MIWLSAQDFYYLHRIENLQRERSKFSQLAQDMYERLWSNSDGEFYTISEKIQVIYQLLSTIDMESYRIKCEALN